MIVGGQTRVHVLTIIDYNSPPMPNRVIELLIFVALYVIYPAMMVNFAIGRKVKMTAPCNFVSLGEKNARTIR